MHGKNIIAALLDHGYRVVQVLGVQPVYGHDDVAAEILAPRLRGFGDLEFHRTRRGRDFGREFLFQTVRAGDGKYIDVFEIGRAQHFHQVAEQRVAVPFEGKAHDLITLFGLERAFVLDEEHAAHLAVVRQDGGTAVLGLGISTHDVDRRFLRDFLDVRFPSAVAALGDQRGHSVAVERAAHVTRRYEQVLAAVVGREEREALARAAVHAADQRTLLLAAAHFRTSRTLAAAHFVVLLVRAARLFVSSVLGLYVLLVLLALLVFFDLVFAHVYSSLLTNRARTAHSNEKAADIRCPCLIMFTPACQRRTDRSKA